MRRLAGLGLVALASSHCTSIVPIGLQAPTLAFRDLQIQQATRERIRFAVEVEARNPNDAPMPIQALAFDLSLAGVSIASGKAVETPFALSALSGRVVRLEMESNTAQLLEAIARLAGGGGRLIDYEIRGRADWGPLGVPLPFSRRGQIDPVETLRRSLRGS